MYFTESTDRGSTTSTTRARSWRPAGSGALFRRDPDGTVSTLLAGLYFANGVTLTADESALVFAETPGRALSKYWLDRARRRAR